MARLKRISQKLIAAAVANDDLTEALFAFQNAVGIDDGGIAGRLFSGRDWDTEWPTATPERRREMMQHYINVERIYA